MGQRDLDATESLLQEPLWTCGPCGQEDAVRDVCARELKPLVDDMWTDDAGTLIDFVGAAVSAPTSTDHRHRTSSIAGGAATRAGRVPDLHHQRGDRRRRRLLRKRHAARHTHDRIGGRAHRTGVRDLGHRRPDRGLQRRVVRLRQRHCRSIDGDRHCPRAVAAGGDVGRLHV